MKDKEIVRSKTISLAVTEDMYAWIKQKTKKMNTTPSTFTYQWLEHSFGDEIKDFKQK